MFKSDVLHFLAKVNRGQTQFCIAIFRVLKTNVKKYHHGTVIWQVDCAWGVKADFLMKKWNFWKFGIVIWNSGWETLA